MEEDSHPSRKALVKHIHQCLTKILAIQSELVKGPPKDAHPLKNELSQQHDASSKELRQKNFERLYEDQCNKTVIEMYKAVNRLDLVTLRTDLSQVTQRLKQVTNEQKQQRFIHLQGDMQQQMEIGPIRQRVLSQNNFIFDGDQQDENLNFAGFFDQMVGCQTKRDEDPNDFLKDEEDSAKPFHDVFNGCGQGNGGLFLQDDMAFQIDPEQKYQQNDFLPCDPVVVEHDQSTLHIEESVQRKQKVEKEKGEQLERQKELTLRVVLEIKERLNERAQRQRKIIEQADAFLAKMNA